MLAQWIQMRNVGFDERALWVRRISFLFGIQQQKKYVLRNDSFPRLRSQRQPRALARTGSNSKLRTRPLLREGVTV
jgi:hypothetical protein